MDEVYIQGSTNPAVREYCISAASRTGSDTLCTEACLACSLLRKYNSAGGVAKRTALQLHPTWGWIQRCRKAAHAEQEGVGLHVQWLSFKRKSWPTCRDLQWDAHQQDLLQIVVCVDIVKRNGSCHFTCSTPFKTFRLTHTHHSSVEWHLGRALSTSREKQSAGTNARSPDSPRTQRLLARWPPGTSTCCLNSLHQSQRQDAPICS